MDSRVRRVTLAVFVGLLVAVAGCSAFGGGSTTNVLLVNNDGTAHNVTVEITEGGEEIYSAETAVDAETDAELSAFEQTGEYTVTVTVDGNATEKTYTFEDGDDTVSIGIANDASVTVGG